MVEEVEDKENPFLRQTGIFNPDDFENVRVTIVGCGGIGSATAICLAKMGFRHFSLWDNDLIENHNLSNQFFGKMHLGRPKTEAVAEMIESFSPINPLVEIHGLVEKDSTIETDILILGTDSLESRKLAYEAAQRASPPQYVIDGRNGRTAHMIYSFAWSDDKKRKMYEKTLNLPPINVAEVNCSDRAVIFGLMGVAAEIGSAARNLLQERQSPLKLTHDYNFGFFTKE